MHTPPSPAALAAARQAQARAIGLSAFVYGYPLVESFRTCRLQTSAAAAGADEGSDARVPIDRLHHSPRPSTDQDRDIVTPANDLLYSTGWIHLGDGPRLLTVPSSAAHRGRYFVLALYDAYTENFENLGPRNCAAVGETVLLVGPGGQVPEALAGHRVLRCPTTLVWLIGRILAGDEADWPAARALQAGIGLAPAPGTLTGRRPRGVENWEGAPFDAMAACFEQGQPAAQVAPPFFANLCRALADAPGRTEDQGLVAWFGQAGLVAGGNLAWDGMDAPLRAGLVEGFAEGVALVAAAARSRRARPWVLASRAGRYGHDYLARALTAYIGLGALATDEALYGAGHFDSQGAPLDGRRRYTLRFAPDEMPPAEAFWSVTLYDADRFLYRNAARRHAIGDRTPGLQFDADGSLQIDFGHTPPPRTANWLPTPAGPFYLILRLYHPREGVRSWRIPALQAVEA
ncbi:DUF1254 domain-containing protein [Pseudorhodoferax soli]|uniref:DUF1254 domain-containing protein n=1 Tax=Pseudorhodoferax soli TaxID=545864 RepID=A0A368XLG3_9BURK|nr:DUF1254 domain-containing protein [Pseudorhodoferax soli]RCW68760.1 hypothetical protein DES41_107282 [Pseudorhodoferax soli]